MRVPWTAKTSNQSILKEIIPEFLLGRLGAEAPILWPPMPRADSLEDSEAGKDWRQKEKGETEDETVGWHCQLKRHEFEQTSGNSEVQGSLACCSPWHRRQSD